MKSLIRGFSTLWNGTDRVDLECEMAWDLGFLRYRDQGFIHSGYVACDLYGLFALWCLVSFRGLLQDLEGASSSEVS